MNQLIKRLIRKMIRGKTLLDRRILRSVASHRRTRDWLNSRYQRYPPLKKERFHGKYSKIFRDRDQKIDPGNWLIEFADKPLRFPLSGDQAWLEWELAVSAIGHETAVKRTYETLIRTRRPELFFDIGASYGQHSLLLLAQGIPTVTFEPNPACHEYFRRICELNGVVGDLQPLALDAEEGWADLCFPETDTWFGTIHATAKEQVSQPERISSLRVQAITLDRFVSQGRSRPRLIKIDTEGNEIRILRGGMETLRTCRPIVIFESWPEWGRDELFGLFETVGYRVGAHPLTSLSSVAILDRDAFRVSKQWDFLALPSEDVG